MGLRHRSTCPQRLQQAPPFRALFIRSMAVGLALLVTASLAAFVATNPAAATSTTRYVAQGGSDTSNDCTSPANPCATISHAVGQSNSGDTINVSGTIDDHVTIATSLTITQWVNHAQAVVDGTNNSVPFTITSGTVVLNKLTIEDGIDGGISNGGTLTLNGSTVSGNSAAFGGGIRNTGTLTLNSSTVSGNTALDGAGAIQDNGATLTLNASTISENTAMTRGAGGIAINTTNQTATITSSTISGNSALQGGGGLTISPTSGTVTVSSSTISDNKGGGLEGGGIDNNATGSFSLNGSTVSGNTAAEGGGIWTVGGTMTVSSSTISGNTATLSGGSGGGIGNDGGTLGVISSTVSGNTASTGAGIWGLSGSTTSGATIVAANSGSNCLRQIGTFTSLGYNLTDDSTGSACGFTATGDVVNANPNLGALAKNGGPTQTLLAPNPSPEAFVIPNPTTLGTTQVCPRTDQRGVQSPSGGACTIGAVEAIPGVAPNLPSGESQTWTTGQSGTSLTVSATGTPTPTITYPYGQSGSGKLPNGLTLSLSPGGATISGTPAANAGGTYNIKLVADNGVSPSSIQTVAVVVQQPPAMSLPPNGGTVGFKAGVASRVPWSVTAPATTWPHITQPVTYTTSGFPAGLNFNNNGNGTGTLSGTLAKDTFGPMSIEASNAGGSSTTTFFIKAS